MGTVAAVNAASAGILSTIGFSAGGVVAGSIAAGTQAGIGSVVGGSLFAGFQSLGALGLGVLGTAALPVALATGAVVAGVIIYKKNQSSTNWGSSTNWMMNDEYQHDPNLWFFYEEFDSLTLISWRDKCLFFKVPFMRMQVKWRQFNRNLFDSAEIYNN
jgi:hypothetical protein